MVRLFADWAVTDNPDNPGGSGLTLLLRVNPNVDGTFAGVLGYRSTTPPTFRIATVWERTTETTGTLLATASTWAGGGTGGPGWDICALNVPAVAGRSYYIGLTLDRFPSDTTSSPLRGSDIVSDDGSITAPANNPGTGEGNGRFNADNGETPAYPNDLLLLGNYYGIDVEFIPTVADPTAVDVTDAGTHTDAVTAAIAAAATDAAAFADTAAATVTAGWLDSATLAEIHALAVAASFADLAALTDTATAAVAATVAEAWTAIEAVSIDIPGQSRPTSARHLSGPQRAAHYSGPQRATTYRG